MVRYALPIYNVRPDKSQYVKELAILELEQVILPDIACLIADFADDLPPCPGFRLPTQSGALCNQSTTRRATTATCRAQRHGTKTTTLPISDSS